MLSIRKASLFILSSIALFPFATSQTSAKDKLVAQACDCITKLNIDSVEDPSTTIHKCIQEGLLPNLSDLQKEENLDLSDISQMREFGIGIGKILVANCPKFMDLSVKLAEQQKPLNGTSTQIKITTGSFLRIEKGDIAKIIIKDDQGNENTFVWLTNFKNSEQFMGAATVEKGKKLKISWTEIEIYIPKAEGYYILKQITEIEIVN